MDLAHQRTLRLRGGGHGSLNPTGKPSPKRRSLHLPSPTPWPSLAAI